MPSQSSQLTKPTWQCAQRWWNAVEAAGLGYYGAATEQLSSVMEDCLPLFVLPSLVAAANGKPRHCGHVGR